MSFYLTLLFTATCCFLVIAFVLTPSEEPSSRMRDIRSASTSDIIGMPVTRVARSEIDAMSPRLMQSS